MEELNKGYEFTKAQIAELESLRAENERLKQIKSRNKSVELLAENETLRARLEELEAQEPVAFQIQGGKYNERLLHPYEYKLNTNPELERWKVCCAPLYLGPKVNPDVEKLKDEISNKDERILFLEQMRDAAMTEIQTLKTEIDTIKQVDFPRKVEAVAKNWMEKVSVLDTDLKAMTRERDRMMLASDCFNEAIDFAIKQRLEASDFLRCWREGDWDGCREFEFPEAEIEKVKQY